MDKRRKELEEMQADLHLAMLMDEYAEKKGKEYREETEAALANGELVIPKEFDDACRAVIDRAPKKEKGQKTLKTAARYALVAAATIVLLFASLIAVQAAGVNVFGRLAVWSDSVFHFQGTAEETSSTEDIKSENEIQTALRELGMPTDLAPTWLPEGYEISMIETIDEENTRTVIATAESATSPVVVITIKDGDGISDLPYWEKDPSQALQFIHNDRTFYVVSNSGLWGGFWSDESTSITIINIESKDSLIKIINSIGEPND